jgi:hypothetical protein
MSVYITLKPAPVVGIFLIWLIFNGLWYTFPFVIQNDHDTLILKERKKTHVLKLNFQTFGM